jgi:hypothetical protein
LIDMEVQPSIGIHFVEGDTWLINPILWNPTFCF